MGRSVSAMIPATVPETPANNVVIDKVNFFLKSKLKVATSANFPSCASRRRGHLPIVAIMDEQSHKPHRKSKEKKSHSGGLFSWNSSCAVGMAF